MMKTREECEEIAKFLDDRFLCEAAAAIRELLTIVEKLPKCWRLNEAGELVQDVPVGGTDSVCWIADDGEVCEGEWSDWHEVWDNDACYSTPEAAKAAKETSK